METLTYLYLAQENESPEVKEVLLNPSLPKRIAASFLSLVSVAGGTLSLADAASAYHCCRPGGGYGFRPAPGYGFRPAYNPRPYYSYYPDYNYYPSYYGGYSYGTEQTGGTQAGRGYLIQAAARASYVPVAPATPANVSVSSPAYSPLPDTYTSDYSSTPDYSSPDYSADYSSYSYVYHGADGVASYGTYGELVSASQEKLKALGYYTGEVDGLFGDITYNAVVSYQKAQGLKLVDGIIGPETRSSLGIK